MNIALLDDDEDHNALIVALLARAGHACVAFTVAAPFTRHLQRETVDLLLLDYTLPTSSGLEVLAWARSHLAASLPIMMITSRSADSDVLDAFARGADDYIIKPFQPAILMARIDALIRRAYPPPPPNAVEVFGAHSFDPALDVVTLDGAGVQLTAKEFQLALVLFRNLSRALSRGYLMQTVWGQDPDLNTRTLDAHVSRIRTKLRLRPQDGFRLSTVYSYGYRLERASSGDMDQ